MSVAEIARGDRRRRGSGEEPAALRVGEAERGNGRWLRRNATRRWRRRYRALGAEEPPRALDEAILAAARTGAGGAARRGPGRNAGRAAFDRGGPGARGGRDAAHAAASGPASNLPCRKRRNQGHAVPQAKEPVPAAPAAPALSPRHSPGQRWRRRSKGPWRERSPSLSRLRRRTWPPHLRKSRSRRDAARSADPVPRAQLPGTRQPRRWRRRAAPAGEGCACGDAGTRTRAHRRTARAGQARRSGQGARGIPQAQSGLQDSRGDARARRAALA